MYSQRVRLGIFATLLLGAGFSAPAVADLGSCEYRLYSTFTQTSHLVCQTVDEAAQCGRWNDTGPKDERYTAYAEGKEDAKVTFRTSPCDAGRAIGMCQLKRGRIYFYEGNPKSLAQGCTRMLGEYFDEAPELTASRKQR